MLESVSCHWERAEEKMEKTLYELIGPLSKTNVASGMRKSQLHPNTPMLVVVPVRVKLPGFL